MEYIDLLEKNFYTLLGLDQNQLYDNNDRPIENEDEIPSEFKQEIVTTKIDKTAIKNHFKCK